MDNFFKKELKILMFACYAVIAILIPLSDSNYALPAELLDIKEKYDARKLKFSSTLEPYLSIYGKDFLNDFYKYWTEPNKSGTKFKQELEKTWDLERRLETWARNDKNFKKNDNAKPTSTTGTFTKNR